MNVTNMRHNTEIEKKDNSQYDIGTTDKNTESLQDVQTGNTANHRYNLRPRPTKHHEKLNLMQIAQQSTYEDNAKPHLQVLMTQMSVKAGIKKFGKRGDDMLTKEL